MMPGCPNRPVPQSAFPRPTVCACMWSKGLIVGEFDKQMRAELRDDKLWVVRMQQIGALFA